uniref:Uncharacterized protein isoform X1 n=1 Tax=Nicotiana tabacum TaxID=4097 RepID=A0A1S3Z9K0_TOBAC|nr:PREDICTED: uncharacterized protein LOC107784425 isoform X1 [Nicotiana tabacum]
MHLEKDICDNILGTLLNIKGKTKDTIKTQLDLQAMNIRKELYPIKNGDKYDLPTACYTLSPEEKYKFCDFLNNLKVPDGFSSNISQCVNLKDRKISGLKSHDCHIILQYVLPLAICGMLYKSVSEPLIELSLFFIILGAKCLSMEELEQIDCQISKTKCKLENVFPPIFFDVMEHLPIHLANEAKIAGPTQYRHMYPMERYIYFMKSLVGNRACPEGSIAEGYLATECLTLCSRYLHTMEIKFNRFERNCDGGVVECDGGLTIFCEPGRALRGGKPCRFDSYEFEQAHIYILKNCDGVQPFLEEISQTPANNSQETSDRQFISWLKEKVEMNPSKSEKFEMESTSKTVKHSFVATGALARGRGQSFRTLDSVRVNAEKRLPIGKSKNRNAAASYLNELAQNKSLAPPSFDPLEDDVSLPQEVEVMQDTQRNEISPCESEKAKKVRGKNRCKNVLGLKVEKMLSVTFYQNRVVGKNSTSFVRHLGILVRDRNKCPLRVHSWADIEEYKLDHMWEVVTDKFDSADINCQRDNVLKHMRRLWNNWRGSLHLIVKSKSLRDVLKDVPEGVDKSDWEWLVKEHFLSEKFKERSMRNSVNKSKLIMPHCTGNKPIREIIYELGGKDSNPPDMTTIFFETHKKDDKLVKPETNEKYAEIQELIQSEPSLINIEVVERCFGPQCKSNVVGFRGETTAKELKGGNSSKATLLDELNATRKENLSLKRRLDNLENTVAQLASIYSCQPSSTPSSTEPDTCI